MLLQYIRKFKLYRLKRKGLQISDDCRLIGMPDFGSEPYLISIGKHVTISGKVTFLTHDGGIFVLPKPLLKYGRITIHDNCFIGHGSIIMPNVSIGPNSIIAAGSVVTKDVPANTIAGGNPAKRLKTIEEYETKCIERNPKFNLQSYLQDKRKELLSILPYPW